MAPVVQVPTVVTPHPRGGGGALSTLPDWWGVLTAAGADGPITGLHDYLRLPLSHAVAPTDLLPVCYGAVRIGGTQLLLAGVTGSETQYGWGVIPWCQGEIEAVDAFYCNAQLMTVYDHPSGLGYRHFTHYAGAAGDYLQDNPYDPFGSYPPSGSPAKDTTGFTYCSYTRVSLYRSIVLGLQWWLWLPGGAPNATYEWSADIRGLKIWDPRGGGSTAYTRNPVLIARDLLSRFGRLVDAEIDDTINSASADASDAAGFTCDVAFTASTTLDQALLTVLQTCNGRIIESNGKKGIYLDLANTSPAVATLSEADADIWGLKYEWISTQGRYTRVSVSFFNHATNKQDVTPDLDDPGIALGTVPITPLVVAAPGISTLPAAIVLRDYIFKKQSVTYRISGTMNSRGISLQEGQKVHLTTFKGEDGDFLVNQIATDAQGFFSFVVQPYDADVYGSTPIAQGEPFVNPAAPDAPGGVAGRLALWSAPGALMDSIVLPLEEATLPALSAAGTATVVMDVADHTIKASVNGGAFAPLGGGGSSPLTTKGDLFGRSTVDARLPVGANGDVLTADSTQTLGVKYATPAAVPSVPLTTKGDILTFDTANQRLAVGADGKVLTADSTKATGLDYKTPAAAVTTTKGDLAGYDTAGNRIPVGADDTLLVADSTKALGVDWKPGSALKFGVMFAQGNPQGGNITGSVDGLNALYILPKTPSSSRIYFSTDNQQLEGGRDYTRIGARVYLEPLANRPVRSVMSIFEWGGPDDGGGTPETPPPGTAATWTPENASSVRDWRKVVWAKEIGLFVAVGGHAASGNVGYVMTSPEGITWSDQTVPVVQNLSCLVWTGVNLVAMAEGSASNSLTSPDGINWSDHGCPLVQFTDLAYGKGAVVAVATNATNRVAYSLDDGVTWTQVNVGSVRGWRGVCFSKKLGLFVAVANTAVSNAVMTSPDGITWSDQTAANSLGWWRVEWSPYLEQFVAISDNSGAGTNEVMTSPDGATWTLQTTPASAHTWRGLIWSDAKKLWVVVGSYVAGGTTEAMTSPDGFAWTLQTTITDSRFVSVASDDARGLLVAVAHNHSGNAQVMISTG